MKSNKDTNRSITAQTATTNSFKIKAISSFDEFFAFKVSIGSSNVIKESLLEEATNDILGQVPNLVYDSNDYPDNNIEYDRLNKYVLKTITRSDDGRLTAPLLWNDKMAHHLGSNFDLTKAVLHSNLKKIKQAPEKLTL